MDTRSLELFATQARRELIAAVEAQASAVLSDGSVARSERGETVTKLEAEIEQHGQKHVIDKVAYTWFNRLIALRYMDALGYTGVGAVSPTQGHAHGQPEILADAKRGHLDDEVIVNERTRDAVMGLLDGSRRSTDPEGEAYALLLTEYCRFWNKAMPFMFEREGDYTELLVPSGLLADGSILSRAREVLTEEVCEDVEVIGWLYQFYISERKDDVFAGFKKNKKAGADEIPAATQLFTPHWIVRYLVENSLGRLWMLNKPGSRLVEQMDYYIAPVDETTDFLKINGPEELTVIDPACGSGHMLTYAFDLLYEIYAEEGYAPSEIPSLIITHNLRGTEIDPRAGALAAFALTMKARRKDRRFFNREVEPRVCVIEPISFESDELDFLVTKSGDRHAEESFWNQFRDADILGSLIRPECDHVVAAAEVLSTLQEDLLYGQTVQRARRVVRQAEMLSMKYAVVVANPPYMGGEQMNARLSQFMKDEYPEVKQDLYGAFVVRGIELTHGNGLLAMIIGETWMFIKSFEALRQRLLDGHAFDSFVHMRDVSNHPDIFGANAAFVLSMAGDRSRYAPFIRLTPLGSARKENDLRAALSERTERSGYHLASSQDFEAIPGTPIVYWLSEKMKAVFLKGVPLREIMEPRQGMATADNARFVRRWWEVTRAQISLAEESRTSAQESGCGWFPYTDGGEFRRWYGNREAIVNWRDDGAELRGFSRAVIRNSSFYFRPAVSWSAIGSGVPAFRCEPQGSLFSNAGMSLFGTDSELSTVAAIGNSTTAERIFAAIAPTLNLGVGEIGRVPIIRVSAEEVIRVDKLERQSRSDWDSFETSWGFERNNLVAIAQHDE